MTIELINETAYISDDIISLILAVESLIKSGCESYYQNRGYVLPTKILVTYNKGDFPKAALFPRKPGALAKISLPNVNTFKVSPLEALASLDNPYFFLPENVISNLVYYVSYDISHAFRGRCTSSLLGTPAGKALENHKIRYCLSTKPDMTAGRAARRQEKLNIIKGKIEENNRRISTLESDLESARKSRIQLGEQLDELTAKLTK